MIKFTAKRHSTDVDMIETKKDKDIYAVIHTDFFSEAGDQDIYRRLNDDEEIEFVLKEQP